MGLGPLPGQERNVELSPGAIFLRYPPSHGCGGHHDEPIQQERNDGPKDQELSDAKKLFEWVLGGEVEDDQLFPLAPRPRVHIIGQALKSQR